MQKKIKKELWTSETDFLLDEPNKERFLSIISKFLKKLLYLDVKKFHILIHK